ncbi:YrzA family protein [Bacillus sp. FJAT-45350]|uniref:YrzA family protein n=1 Tax=Bacillus sp. FJAT-45350 TaxID=2011014 RepID=UPI000BB9AC03|nr:YrzA family protein [Bacillus sp. FJAT-45350]
MGIQLERIHDKVEFFETANLQSLEKKINEQIDINKALLLEVHSISHQVFPNPKTGQPIYSAVVHFRAKG